MTFAGSNPPCPASQSGLHYAIFRGCENCRYSRGLGWRAGVFSRQILEFQVRTGGFVEPVSARHFPISVSACPRPVRYVTETGLRSRFRACTAAKRTRFGQVLKARGRSGPCLQGIERSLQQRCPPSANQSLRPSHFPPLASSSHHIASWVLLRLCGGSLRNAGSADRHRRLDEMGTKRIRRHKFRRGPADIGRIGLPL
jgi:hypothetical protein